MKTEILNHLIEVNNFFKKCQELDIELPNTFNGSTDICGRNRELITNFQNELINELKTKAGQFLSFDESDEEILVMVKSIKEQSKKDGSILIDYVENVQTAEAFEFQFTCDEFLEMI